MNRVTYMFYKALCYIISLVLTVSICGACTFIIFSATCSNENYVSKYFMADAVTDNMYKLLEEKLAALSDAYNLPEYVLKDAVDADFRKSAQLQASKPIRGGVPIDFTESTEVVSAYEQAISNYNKESNSKLSKKKITKISKKAAQIFDDTYTIKNTAQFGTVSNLFVKRTTVIAFLFILIGIVCALALYLINGRRRKGFNYHAMAVMTSGELMIAVPIFLSESGFSKRINLTTVAAYNDAITSSFEPVFYIFIIAGALLMALAVIMFISNYRHYELKFKNNSMENEIQRNLI